jgi:hypothetical protein
MRYIGAPNPIDIGTDIEARSDFGSQTWLFTPWPANDRHWTIRVELYDEVPRPRTLQLP